MVSRRGVPDPVTRPAERSPTRTRSNCRRRLPFGGAGDPPLTHVIHTYMRERARSGGYYACMHVCANVHVCMGALMHVCKSACVRVKACGIRHHACMCSHTHADTLTTACRHTTYYRHTNCRRATPHSAWVLGEVMSPLCHQLIQLPTHSHVNSPTH